MAVKYRINYKDTEGVEHECTISDDNFVGSETDVQGSVLWSLAETKEPGEIIRGTGLTINLDASTDLNYNDLYSEEERTFYVQYNRDGSVMFNGWLTSDGIYQDYVSDKWIISIDCTDGLGYLTELSYVDSNGVIFSGNQTLLEIIVNCLKRTGVSQNINTNIDIYYTGLSTSLNMLDNVYYNADRFVKDDGETIMSCEEVLKDVLAPFGASITSINGEWVIYKLNTIYLDEEPTFFRYDSDGIALAPPTDVINFLEGLGSQIDNYYPHFVNANQSIRNYKSIGAYRISYKYGVVKSLLSNIYLEHNGVTIDEWTINSLTNITLNASGFGVTFTAVDVSILNLTSDVISLSAGDQFNYTLKYETLTLTKNGVSFPYGFFRYRIILDGVITYYWTGAGWSTTNSYLLQDIGEIGETVSIQEDLDVLPIGGDVYIEVWSPFRNDDRGGINYADSTVSLNEVSVNTSSNSTREIQGEFHTFQREDKPSTKIKENVRVNNGDNPSDIYYGTIYKTDGTTPTDTWFRKGVTESKPILRIMGEETLRLNASTSFEFSGDFYGYIPHYSIVEINNIIGVFVFIDYNYDTLNNVTSFKLRQIFGDELTDINYSKTFDYGNVVKPTIKG